MIPSRVPVMGIGSSSLGPTQPSTALPVCLNDALPIAPPGVEILTCQPPVTSAA
jgi:hypothetical protein